MFDKLDTVKKRVIELGELMCNPNVIADNKEYARLAKELKNLQPISDMYDKYTENENSLKDAKEMLELEEDEQNKAYLQEEIDACLKNKEKFEEELKLLLLPKDENDEKNVVLELRAGTGGEEAALFAAEVMRMYLRFAEKHKFSVETVNITDTELGGIKEAEFMIKGAGAYSWFKFESGVHRVQRVPETETQGRVHTSAMTVAVLPEAPDIDYDIDEKDLRIDVCRSSGAGGQHINKTESAIRIVHLPTGITVFSQEQRSQLQNKETAMASIKAKVYDYYKTKADTEYAKQRQLQIGSGDRSERIRTYNYPQSRVTDHRIGMTLYSLEQFLQGDMDEMIEALKLAEQKQKLESQE